MKKILSVLISLMLVSGLILAGCGKEEEPEKEMYLASDTATVVTYTKDDDGNLVPSGEEVRGTKVVLKGKTVTQDEINYEPLKKAEDAEKDDPTIYFAQSDLVETPEECVREKDKYVRTSVTPVAGVDDCTIKGFIWKGSHVSITGFDSLSSDGLVNMYQVTADDGTEGWVYAKYLVDTQEDANAVNQEYYELNKDKIYDGLDLYGGDPGNLDYFYYDKVVNSSSVMPSECRAYYLNAGCIDAMDDYIDCCREANANAVVIDIKDGALAYHAEIANSYTPSSYETAYHNNADYKAGVQKAKDAGLWTIGRIVVFNDSFFADDNPGECILEYGENAGWPSAYSRKAWEYNVKLAISAVQEMGFDEIQFDYVRFPENAYGLSDSGAADFRNTYGEEKAQAVQNFCRYAADSIHQAGAYFSVDVFGECSDGYVTAYGQYWPAISNVVDAVSSMPYIDHFGREAYTWTDGYSTMYNWARGAYDSQQWTPNPARPRTWLTCYSVPYWEPEIPVTSPFLEDQIQALWDAGIGDGGFITWNVASNLGIYYTVAPAFARSYQ